jgi:GAF domain-containing protein
VDPVTEQVTHLVMREGHLWGQTNVTVPVAEIDRLGESTIYLKLNKDQVEALRRFPSACAKDCRFTNDRDIGMVGLARGWQAVSGVTESQGKDMQGTISSLDMLRKIARAVNSAVREPEIIDALLDQAVATLGARAAILRLLSPDGDELLQAGARGLSDTYLAKGPVRVAESGMDQRILASEIVSIRDITQDKSLQYPQAAATEGLQGMVATPLRVRSQIIGVLRIYVDDTEQLRPEAIVAIGILADLGALALEKARLHQSLYGIAEALSASLELEPMLQQVLEAAVKEMWLKAASIRLLDPNRQILHLVAAYGLSEAYLAKGTVHLAKSPVDQRVLQGSAVVLYDVEHEAGFEYPAEALHEGIRSVLAVPLGLKERTLGVMRVYSARPRHFGPVAIRFLTSTADLVALAIENARLYAALQARYEDLKLDVAEWHRFLALG